MTPTFFSVSLFSSTCSCGRVKKSACLCSKYLSSLLRHVYVNRLVWTSFLRDKMSNRVRLYRGLYGRRLRHFDTTVRCAAHCAGATLSLTTTAPFTLQSTLKNVHVKELNCFLCQPVHFPSFPIFSSFVSFLLSRSFLLLLLFFFFNVVPSSAHFHVAGPDKWIRGP